MTPSRPPPAIDIEAELKNAEAQAWGALAHGKYAMFGYWAAWHVKLRKMAGLSHTPSPFANLRGLAKYTIETKYPDGILEAVIPGTNPNEPTEADA